jgi:long-chain acyl-CoA synthetase
MTPATAEVDYRLADLIREHARDRPADIAMSHGDRSVTYAELHARSSRYAQALLSAGVGVGSRVAHLDQNAPEALELLVAAAKIGAVLVPLNWRLSTPELRAVITDAGAMLVTCGPSFAEMTRAAAGDVRVQVVGPGTAGEDWLRNFDDDDPSYAPEPGTAVLQLYTSGTTGSPKGVLTTHANLACLAAGTAPFWSFDSTSVSLVSTPLFHIGGMGWLLVGIQVGARNVLLSQVVPDELVDVLERERITNAFLVPTILHMVNELDRVGGRDFSALRSIAYGGSPITTPVLEASLRTFGCELFQLYGLTETTGAIVQLDATDHDPNGSRAHLMRSAGRPYPWVEVAIVDPRSGDALPVGRIGEVRVRGANVTPGYHERPADTDAAMADGGWFCTGDGGYLDGDGYLFLTDRIKDMIVSGGENVYPIEVEDVLARHPDVLEVAVVGVSDERWGEVVTAVVVARSAAAPTLESLLTFCRPLLAAYKLPRRLVLLDELPKTPTGKVVKRELRASLPAAALGSKDQVRT